jgi:hypothetical protein
VPGADVEVVDAGGGGDDVDDGVDCADLVEVDRVDGDVVDAGFGFAEEGEGAQGEVLDGLRERGGGDEGADLGERTGFGVTGLFVDVDVGFFVVGVAWFVEVLGFGLEGIGGVVGSGLLRKGCFSGNPGLRSETWGTRMVCRFVSVFG